MPLTLEQKQAVTRHLNYPLIGLPRVAQAGGTLAAGTTASYRYFQAYSMLQYRLNNLQAVEEAALTGGYYASVSVIGPTPNVGDTLVATFTGTFTGSPVVITVTVTPQMIIPNPPDPVYINSNAGLGIVANLSQQVLQDAALVAAGFSGFSPYGSGPFNYSNISIPLPEATFTAPIPFTLSLTTTGVVAAQLVMNGQQQVPPFLPALPGYTTTPTYGYIPILNYLESAYGGTSQNLDTAVASVWTARRTELAERMSLYIIWREKLAAFLDIPVNPSARAGNFRGKGFTSYM